MKARDIFRRWPRGHSTSRPFTNCRPLFRGSEYWKLVDAEDKADAEYRAGQNAMSSPSRDREFFHVMLRQALIKPPSGV